MKPQTAIPNPDASEKTSASMAGGGRGSALAALLVLLAGDLAAVFLGGGPRQGGMGIFLLTAGLILILIRPSRVVPWNLVSLGALLIAACAASLLPQGWFPSPCWRSLLASVPLIVLPTEVTMDPRVTVFWIALVGASVIVGLYVLAIPLSVRRMETFALVAALGCTAYALLALYSYRTGWQYPFFTKPSWSDVAFGFLPNRNHTAGFLLAGAIVSLGLVLRGVGGGRILSAVLGGCIFAVLAVSLLFFSVSRGGLVFFLLGVLIWVAGLGRHRTPLLLGVLCVVFALLASKFLSSGGELLERFKGPEQVSMAQGPHPAGEGDARIAIWQDTLGMARDYPLTGTGLGNYPLVYGFYARKSLADGRTALHAESDWLTLCSEAGIPSLVISGIILFVLLSGLRLNAAALREGWPLRWALVSACVAELLHGFVDTPLHRVEVGWWVLLLGAVGFATGAGQSEPRVRSLAVQRCFFLLLGLPVLLLGAAMIRAEWWHGESLPPFSQEVEQRRIMDLFGKGDRDSVARSMHACREAILRYPAHGSLYHQAGILELNAGGDPARAAALFRASDALLPHATSLLREQGEALYTFDAAASSIFWAEALRRQFQITDNPALQDRTYSLGMATDLFGAMISFATNHPLMMPFLSSAAAGHPDLRLQWLAQSSCTPAEIAAAARDDRYMAGLTPQQRGKVFELWWSRGDWSEISDFLDAHPGYQRDAAATYAATFAAAGQHEEACRRLIGMFSIPVDLAPKPPVGASIRPVGGDIPDSPLAAAKFCLERGNDISCRRYLAEASKVLVERDQADFSLLKARLAISEANWKEALDDLIAYLRASGQL